MLAPAQTPEQKQDLHVLTLTPFYPSQEDNTTGCFVSEPIGALAKLGITNTVYAVQPFYRRRLNPCGSSIASSWLRYFSLPSGLGLSTAGAFLFARIIPAVRKLQQVRRIDLIHAHAPLPCGHAAMLIAEELGIPFVISVHGLDAFSTEQVVGRGGQWARRLSQRIYHSARRVICISERVREKVLEGAGGTCRTSVVYNGVDPDVFSPGMGKVSEEPVLLCVGNLIPTKGQDLFLRAAAPLFSEFRRLQVEIIGTGPAGPQLANLSRQLGIEARVKFPGRQSRQEVANAMRRCTLFALPSRFEGLGCVYLEAMSTAKPVVGCRGQGIAEIVRHGTNGFLVGPDNQTELSLALALLLRDEPLRSNLGRHARDTILDRFTLEQQAGNLRRIYRESVP
jgi:glycosyltransferase involved in cell wall biosynthesis